MPLWLGRETWESLRETAIARWGRAERKCAGGGRHKCQIPARFIRALHIYMRMLTLFFSIKKICL